MKSLQGVRKILSDSYSCTGFIVLLQCSKEMRRICLQRKNNCTLFNVRYYPAIYRDFSIWHTESRIVFNFRIVRYFRNTLYLSLTVFHPQSSSINWTWERDCLQYIPAFIYVCVRVCVCVCCVYMFLEKFFFCSSLKRMPSYIWVTAKARVWRLVSEGGG